MDEPSVSVIQKSVITYRFFVIDNDVLFFRIYHMDERFRRYSKHRADNSWRIRSENSPGYHPDKQIIDLWGLNRKLDFKPSIFVCHPYLVEKYWKETNEALLHWAIYCSCWNEEPRKRRERLRAVEVYPTIISIADQETISHIQEYFKNQRGS
jgi:hypothetical protein